MGQIVECDYIDTQYNDVTYLSGNIKLPSLILNNIFNDIKNLKIENKNFYNNLKYIKSAAEFNSLCELNNLKISLTANRYSYKIVYNENQFSKKYYGIKVLEKQKIYEIFNLSMISKTNRKRVNELIQKDIKLEVDTFELKKKDKNKSRTIYSLKNSDDKEVHSKLNKYINLMQIELFKDIPVFSYIEGRSYKGFLSEHTKCTSLMKIDIKDFFPSIQAHYLEKELKKNINNDDLIKYLVFLSTVNSDDKKILAQGLPLSASISNLYLISFDKKITEFTKKNNLKYSRYCDDIIISSNDIKFSYEEVLNKVCEDLSQLNLFINNEKTEYQTQTIKVSNIFIKERLYIPSNKHKKLYNIVIKAMNASTRDLKEKTLLEFYSTRYYYDKQKHALIKNNEDITVIDSEFKKLILIIRGKIQYYIHINPYQLSLMKLIKIYNIACNESRHFINMSISNLPLFNSVVYLILQNGDIIAKEIRMEENQLIIKVSIDEIENCEYALSYVDEIEQRHDVSKEVKPGNVVLGNFLLDLSLPSFSYNKTDDDSSLLKQQIKYYWS